MNSDRLNQWMTLGANFAVLAGILLLLIELRQNTESTELQAAQDYLSLSHELDFRIVDDPTLIDLFLKPADERSAADVVRLDRWNFGLFRTWENGYLLHSKGVLDGNLWLGQEAFMADMLKGEVELRNYYQTNRRYFSKEFVAFLDGLLDASSE